MTPVENTINFNQAQRQYKPKAIDLIPRTRNQERLVMALQDSAEHIVVTVGPAGTGKTYLAMLAAGGTKHHSELLQPFGLDARDPAFWQVGLSLIERMIAELETMD